MSVCKVKLGKIEDGVKAERGGASGPPSCDSVGSTGVRSFTDDTLPSGSARATHEITAVRSTSRESPAWFTVNFGVGGEGAVIASVARGSGVASASLAA